MTSRFLLLSLGCLLAADSRQEADKDGTKTLKGTWTIVAVFDADGKRVPVKADGQGPSRTIVFEASKGVFKDLHGKNRHQEFTYKLDPTKRPKQIDFKDATEDRELWLGIYELDGDTLKLCFARTRTGRPTEFKQPKGTDRGAAFELKREKAK
jgi:uncharacterized protein (TIGR03067 family)